jgi:tripeptidyl-peptidase-1
VNANEFQWIQFDATAAEVEELLIAEFFVWEHISGTHDISTEAYHLPSHIQEHVEYVTPGTRLRTRNLKRRSTSAGELTKRSHKSGRPDITRLPGFPNPNSSDCDVYVTKECTQGMSSFHSTI